MKTTCNECNASWDVGDKMFDKCPFCGTLIKNISTKINGFSDAIKAVLRDYGIDILRTTDRFIALLYDYAPDHKKEIRLIGFALKAGISKIIIETDAHNVAQQEISLSKMHRVFCDDLMWNEEFSISFCGYIADALNWKCNRLNGIHNSPHSCTTVRETDEHNAVNNLAQALRSVETSYGVQDDFSKVRIGDVVKFGEYKIPKSNEKAALKWRVLDIQNDKMLVILNEVLEFEPLNEKHTSDIKWTNSSLRMWLNSQFLMNAFTVVEQQRIIQVSLQNEADLSVGVIGQEDSIDKVFCLNTKEIDKYFGGKKDRVASISIFTKRKSYADKNGYCGWWSRSAQRRDAHFSMPIHVNIDGEFDGRFFGYCDRVAVRPAMYIKI